MLDQLPTDIAWRICSLLSTADRWNVALVSNAWAEIACCSWTSVECKDTDQILNGIGQYDTDSLTSLKMLGLEPHPDEEELDPPIGDALYLGMRL